MYGIHQMMEQVRNNTQKYNKTFLTDDERRQIVSRKSSNEHKHDFIHHKQTFNFESKSFSGIKYKKA